MVKNKMNSNIEKDAFGVPYVVDEDARGTKAIPLVFVTKGSGGEFEYGGTPAGRPSNKMKRPIEEDSEGVVQVVDEDINGVKAIPFVVVTKDESGAFIYGGTIGGGNGGGGGTATTWLNGAAAPTAAVGNDGDYYLHTTTADIYAKTAGAWAKVANIKGATGAAGAAGATGPAGPKGDTGAAGAVGATGATGPKGDTGATGAAGFGTKAQYDDIIARLTALETPQG